MNDEVKQILKNIDDLTEKWRKEGKTKKELLEEFEEIIGCKNQLVTDSGVCVS